MNRESGTLEQALEALGNLIADRGCQNMKLCEEEMGDFCS